MYRSLVYKRLLEFHRLNDVELIQVDLIFKNKNYQFNK